jgi:prepilin peptidase CpaA
MLAITLATITLLITSIAVYTDVRWGKIFNALTFPALGVGLVINTVVNGGSGALLSVEGIALGFALFIVSAIFGRILGGGDIKLLMAIGALQGPVFLAWALLYTALAGAVLALVVGLYRGVLGQRVRFLFASLYLRINQGVPMEMNEAAGTSPRLPYAIAIGLGSLVTICVLHVF